MSQQKTTQKNETTIKKQPKKTPINQTVITDSINPFQKGISDNFYKGQAQKLNNPGFLSAQRQNLVTNIGQIYGNQCVQKLVMESTQTYPKDYIQKNDNNTSSNQNQGFVPAIKPDSSGEPTIRIFDHHIHSWTINNWQTAPQNTFFHWDHGIGGGGILKLIGSDTKQNGATKHVWIQGRKPGWAIISGDLIYQVPGGSRITKNRVFAQVKVATPKANKVQVIPITSDGNFANINHLSPKDKLIVRVRISNVDGNHMKDPTVSLPFGQGNDAVTLGDMRPLNLYPDGRSYDIELTVNRPSSLNLGLKFGIGDMPIGTGPKIKGITGEVECARKDFLELCNQCNTEINLAYTNANSIMEVLSAAYGNAWQFHLNTLKNQGTSNRLKKQLILNAALAFIPGGIGSIVGGFLKNRGGGDFLAGAITDMTKAGLKSGQSQGIMAGDRNNKLLQPMAMNPLTWRAQYNLQNNKEKTHILSLLSNWQDNVNTSNPNFYRNFNPVEITRQALTIGGQSLRYIPVPDQAENERLFELGFWRHWLENYGYTVSEEYYSSPGRGSLTLSTPRNNVGDKIRARINKLGESGFKWLIIYGGVAFKKAQEEAARRNHKRYPRHFPDIANHYLRNL